MRNWLRAKLLRYGTSEEAATAIEYSLIAAGIALAIILSIFAFGEELLALFTAMETEMEPVATALS